MRRRMQWMVIGTVGMLLSAPLATIRAQEAPAPAPAEAAPIEPGPTAPADSSPATPSPADSLPSGPATAPGDLAPTTAEVAPATAPSDVTDPAPAPAPAVTAAPIAPTPVATTGPAAPEEQLLNPALAERLVSMAAGLLRYQKQTPAIWEYVTALLEGATRLSPDDPRYARFLIEAATRSGDTELAIKALQSYRKTEDGKTDEFAQLQLIDLYLGRMQSADQKLEYLNAIIDSKSPDIRPAVRSQCAVRCAGILADKMQNDQAWQMLEKAVELNPLNLDALRARFSVLQQAGKPEDVLTCLLRMELSSPAQPAIGIGIARQLASAGMVQRALEWYTQSMFLHSRLGQVPPNDVRADYACEVFINNGPGDAASATKIVDQLLETDPYDLNAWFIRLILAKHAGDKPAMEPLLRRAMIAMTNRLATLRNAAGDTAATTRPVDTTDPVTFPDPEKEVQFVMASGRQDLVDQFRVLAAAVAWYRLYFEEKPPLAMPWIKALTAIAGESDEAATRLHGWAFLLSGNKEEAKKKLEPIADRDSLAALGYILLLDEDPATKEDAKKRAQQALNQFPAGLEGAMLTQGLSKFGVKVQPGPVAAAFEPIMNDFPKDWTRVLDQPQTFYSLRLDPVRVGVPVGDPILVQVTLKNISRFPLTMGKEGVIHNDLWLDAQLRGVQMRQFPAEAYALLAGPLVLLPNDVVKQVIRLDQTQLGGFLDSFPTGAFQLTAYVMTNPVSIDGGVARGPAGQQATLSKLMERAGTAIRGDTIEKKLAPLVTDGTPTERLRAVEVLSKVGSLLAGEGANDFAKQLAAQASELVRRASADPDPTVRAWANFYRVLTGNPSVVNELLKDPAWCGRVLGIVATDHAGQPHEVFASLAENDPDPVVRKLAKAALVADIRRGAATQPAGASTQPGVAEASPTTAPVSAPPSVAPAPQIAAPAPVAPAPVAPSPVAPAPVEPAPLEPAAVTPAPVQPQPAAPAPAVELPAPTAPAPVAPTVEPVTPAPVAPPEPVSPAPSPAPVAPPAEPVAPAPAPIASETPTPAPATSPAQPADAGPVVPPPLPE